MLRTLCNHRHVMSKTPDMAPNYVLLYGHRPNLSCFLVWLDAIYRKVSINNIIKVSNTSVYDFQYAALLFSADPDHSLIQVRILASKEYDPGSGLVNPWLCSTVYQKLNSTASYTCKTTASVRYVMLKSEIWFPLQLCEVKVFGPSLGEEVLFKRLLSGLIINLI